MKNESKSSLWAGRIMSGLVVAFLIFDVIGKFTKPEMVIETTVNELGFKEHHIFSLGVILLICTALYSFPKTSILGAVLLTGYFGGAAAIHLRIDNPLFSHQLFSVYLGILAWGGLWLRNEKLRAIFPLNF
jgi:hypothetical protein